MRVSSGVALAVLLLVGLAAPGRTAPRRPALGDADAKLETHLRALAPAPPASRLVPLSPARGSKARVFVTLTSTDKADLAQLRRAGLRIDRVLARYGLVRGRIRKKDLPRLAALDAVRSVDPVRPGVLRVGARTTDGDADARGPQARATGFDGTGVTVGVISDGIDRAPLSIASGDLPAGAGVPVPPSPTCGAGSGDEGTAMMEIVHDLAPGATLRFSEGLSDKVAFIDSLDCLEHAGVQVLVDDVSFLDEPFFEDGPVADAVHDAVAKGISYHSAAGNAADIHYSAPFAATDTPEGTYHAFAAGPDLFDRMNVPPHGTLVCVLQWNDRFGASSNDYDLELWDLENATPAVVDVSQNVQSGTQNPFEAVGAHNPTDIALPVGLRIRRESGANRQMKVVCLGAESLQYRTAAGSIFGHPSLPEVVAVGAMNADDFGLNDVEPFSSQGPVTISFPTPGTRHKPDLMAYDGVRTTVFPSQADCFDPFFGTSAAAPHSAGVAALLLSKNACLSPAEVQQKLAAGAIDVLPAGFDEVSGAGRLDAFNVLTAPDACDDGNACTRDTCSPGVGCQHTPLADGAPCPDGDLCNGDETCAGGTCTPGTPLVCDDGSACTTDSCSPAVGCLFQDTCDDGDPCTTDTCDAATGCAHATAPDGTPCPDADLCNGDETCVAGTCTAGTPAVCDQGGACTTGACDAARGCVYTPIEGFPGITCLCGAGLDAPGCAAPGGATARFARGCALVAKAEGAKPKKARRLLKEAGARFDAAAAQTRRAGNRERITPECAVTVGTTLEDILFRTLRVSSGL